MDQIKIGKFIALCRKEKELTQNELAEKLGVSNRTISNWENGKYLPDYGVLIPLCNELGITIVELLTGEKQVNEDKENNRFEHLEKMIDFISWNQKVNIKQCKKTGIILFVGGILICIFSLFVIPPSRTAFEMLFTLIGGVILLLGFSYMNKGYNRKKRIILNVVSVIGFVIFLSIYDLINMAVFNNEPKFHDKCSYMGSSEYCSLLFYDAYRCFEKDDKFHITYKGYVDVYGNTTDIFNFCD